VDLVVGLLMLAVALLFVGIALHAGRDKGRDAERRK
jgi:hypothetical protein